MNSKREAYCVSSPSLCLFIPAGYIPPPKIIRQFSKKSENVCAYRTNNVYLHRFQKKAILWRISVVA